jgi:DNA modification methylase
MTVRIITGDCREALQGLASASVHCVVTSPPYWRQRDYGVAGQLGLEPTPEQYVADLVAILSEAHRALRDDGTLWLNIGDKWSSGGHGGGGSYMADRGDAWAHAKDAKGWRSPPPGYKDKDLVGIPWMTAFALRAQGWYLRQCNIWAKPNGMPESVDDRTTISHEYVFTLSKQGDYYYDHEAVRLPAVPDSVTRLQRAMRENLANKDFVISGGGYDPPGQGPHQGARSTLEGTPHGRHALGEALPAQERRKGRGLTPRHKPHAKSCDQSGLDSGKWARNDKQRGHSRRHNGFNDRWDAMPVDEQRANGANLRSVWYIAPAQYAEGHYAVMPDELAAVCILAGCPKGGTVLDPFGGAGTTGLVADRLGRDAILVELNPEYAAMAEQRIKNDSPMFAVVNT